MKLLCRQIIRQLTGEGVNYEKITMLTTSKRITWNSGDVKALIAAIHFILSNSAKYEVDAEVLPQELAQLGLPNDICKAIVREYTANQVEIREYLISQTLHFSRLKKTEWRADYVLSSNDTKTVAAPSIRMKLHLSKPVVTLIYKYKYIYIYIYSLN